MPISLGTTTVTALFLGTTSITSAYLGATQVFGGSFTPLSLFSSGSQGIWLDPSDLATMFSDRTGTTPVTTPGTVVGLRLDKSKGLVLGAELVVNGTFASSANWTLGATWSIAGGVASKATGDTASIFQDISALTLGSSYVIELDQSYSVGPFSILLRVGTGGAVAYNAVLPAVQGRVRIIINAAAAATRISIFNPNSTASGTIDNISVRELPGNHAVAPTDAARPIYGVEPKGGRRNLLTWSEGFDNAAGWSIRNGLTVPATQYLAPDGTTTAESLVFTSNTTDAAQQDVINLAPVLGVTFTFSLWLRCASGTITIRLGITQPSVVDYTTEVTVTSVWQRFSFSQAFGSAGTSARVRVVSNVAGTTGTVFAWGAQLETGSTATAYQRVTTAYDITESGVATTHYVQYDGSDDSMSTAAIDFTGTDKMSVFAGVRKLSDVAFGASDANVIAEIGGTNITMSLAGATGFNTGQKYNFYSKGTTAATALTTSSTYAAPVSNVVTGLGDISGDLATLRINGSQIAQVTTDQGTGNYGNNVLFIGRRNNATLPFNGRDFGIIVVGKAASAGEITDTETWLAAKTAQVTL